MATPVKFEFKWPDGSPLALTAFEVRNPRAGFIDSADGVIMPETNTYTTDANGEVTAELESSSMPYYVSVPNTDATDPTDPTCGYVRYKFYVPVSATVIRAQDLFLAPPPSTTSYDEAAILAITQNKLDAQTAAESAATSAESAAESLAGMADNAERAEAAQVAAEAASASALASKQAASLSSTNAATSATNAAASAAAALASQTAAKTSETNAKTSETNATASATAANTSKTAAAASATTASTAATTATTQANNASTSATNAKTSETNSKTSETNAATSAAQAAASASGMQPLDAKLSAISSAVLTANNTILGLNTDNSVVLNTLALSTDDTGAGIMNMTITKALMALYGVGGTAPLAANLDTLAAGGIYRVVSSSTTSAPGTGLVLHMQYGSSGQASVQLFINTSSTSVTMQMRSKATSTAYTDWLQLTTVAQATALFNAFGLGTTQMSTAADCDALTTTGWLRTTSNTLNRPNSQSGAIMTMAYGTGVAAQLYITSGGVLLTRYYSGTATGVAWVEVPNTTSIASILASYGLASTTSPAITDANAPTATGTYALATVANGGVNGPSQLASIGWNIFHYNASTTNKWQIASPQTTVSTNKAKLYHRQCYGGTWSEWYLFMDAGNNYAGNIDNLADQASGPQGFSACQLTADTTGTLPDGVAAGSLLGGLLTQQAWDYNTAYQTMQLGKQIYWRYKSTTWGAWRKFDNTPIDSISGLIPSWVSATSITVSTGTAYIPGTGRFINVTTALTLSGLTLTSGAWYHLYVYDNSGTAAIELVTTAPTSPYQGNARYKTGDNTRRWLGAFLATGTNTLGMFLFSTDGFTYHRSGSALAPLRVVAVAANAAPTTNTNISFIAAAPTTTQIIRALGTCPISTSIYDIYFLDSADATAGSASTGSLLRYITGGTSQTSRTELTLPLSATQTIAYRATNAVGGLTLDVVAYGNAR